MRVMVKFLVVLFLVSPAFCEEEINVKLVELVIFSDSLRLYVNSNQTLVTMEIIKKAITADNGSLKSLPFEGQLEVVREDSLGRKLLRPLSKNPREGVTISEVFKRLKKRVAFPPLIGFLPKTRGKYRWGLGAVKLSNIYRERRTDYSLSHWGFQFTREIYKNRDRPFLVSRFIKSELPIEFIIITISYKGGGCVCRSIFTDNKEIDRFNEITGAFYESQLDFQKALLNDSNDISRFVKFFIYSFYAFRWRGTAENYKDK